MRSYFNGTPSVMTGGTIPATPGVWVHIAAVTDGVTRKHYINGELVFQATETAARSVSTRASRIGSDPDWDFMAEGGIDDLRIWKVARTQDQIRQTMFAPFIQGAEDVGSLQGLEAWYRFEGDAMDSWRTHHGTIIGTGIGFEHGVVFTPRGRRALGH
jgi:hypothetical protein